MVPEPAIAAALLCGDGYEEASEGQDQEGDHREVEDIDAVAVFPEETQGWTTEDGRHKGGRAEGPGDEAGEADGEDGVAEAADPDTGGCWRIGIPGGQSAVVSEGGEGDGEDGDGEEAGGGGEAQDAGPVLRTEEHGEETAGEEGVGAAEGGIADGDLSVAGGDE